MANLQKIKRQYNKKYFEDRDHLPPPLASAVKIFMQESKLKKVLDVGCGTGRLVEFLNKNQFEAYGSDNSKIAIKHARKINRKNSIILASATKLPFADESFDLVTSISVIEHLTPRQAKKFILEVKRVLKQKGFIFLVTPNFATPIRLFHGKNWFGFKDPTHINFYTPFSLANLLKKYGFDKIKLLFKTDKNVSYDFEFPGLLSKLPRPLKITLIFLLFSSPFTFIRNSFWISAQKDKN